MKIKVQGKTEFNRFNNFMHCLVAVPHSEIKAKLDAEKRAKKRTQAIKRKRGHEIQ